MNSLDSAKAAAGLAAAGFEIVNRQEDADAVVVNTCTVTATADRKSAQAGRGAEKRGKHLVVIGCGPAVDLSAWKKDFASAEVFGNLQDFLVAYDVQPIETELPITERTRLPIAIQTGCDCGCTFCLTRIARGKSESFAPAKIIAEIHRAEAAGISEIVLTGINIAAYGCKNTNQPDHSRFAEMLRKILTETTIPRIRLSSLGPQYLDEQFFKVFADERICDFLHLSIQSGSPEILQKMARGHGVDEIRRIAIRAREVRPDVCLAADLIAGFPGESDENFVETVALAEEIRLAKIHAFPFSPRPGTVAGEMTNQLALPVKKARAEELRKLGQKLRAEFIGSQVGKTAAVLVEADGTGLSTNYLRVRVSDQQVGEIVKVELNSENLTEKQEG